MKTKYNLAITIEPDDIAEHIAIMISDELTLKGANVEDRWFTLVQAGLLMEITLKEGNLGNKLLKFGDMQLAVFVSK